MNLTTIAAPPFEPVTLQQVYTHLRLDPSGSPLEHADDAMLRGFITTAREHVERETRRSLIQQTLRLSAGAFPAICGGWRWLERLRAVTEIRLLRPPLIRVESVGYYDGDNILQTVDPTDYYVTDDLLPELRFVTGFSAPIPYERPDALRIDYVAGFAPSGSPATTQEEYAANVPQTFKDAILIGVQLLYDNPPPQERDALERMRAAMLQPYRVLLTP